MYSAGYSDTKHQYDPITFLSYPSVVEPRYTDIYINIATGAVDFDVDTQAIITNLRKGRNVRFQKIDNTAGHILITDEVSGFLKRLVNQNEEATFIWSGTGFRIIS